MDYKTGKEYMEKLAAQEGQGMFSPDKNHNIIIEFPGKFKPGDYVMKVCEVPAHTELWDRVFKCSKGKLIEFVAFLDDIYLNGTDIDLSKYTAIDNSEYLMQLIFWETLQEDINYPPPFQGRKLTFCRLYEAVVFSQTPITDAQIQALRNRCNNHKSGIPSLYQIPSHIPKPCFYQ